VIAALTVTGQGVFDARLTWAKLPNMHLARAEEALAREATIALSAGLVFVSFATAPGTELFWNGACVGPDALVVHGCGERFAQRIGGAGSWGFFSIAPAFFARYASALAGRALGVPAQGRIVRPRPADMKRLLRLHARVARLAQTRPTALIHPEVARGLEHEVLHALVNCLGEAAS
jgi:hypothetical protein